MRDALPVVLAVTAFGVSFGVLATTAGMPEWLAVVMSATVFAGSAQFAVVSVISSGGNPLAAVMSGALLNSRYLATGTVAARVLRGPRLTRILKAQLVIDESYALGARSGTPARPDGRVMVTSGAAIWIGWVAGTTTGVVLGPVVGDPATLGLDAAFPAIFVALLWPMLRDRRGLAAAAAGALTTLALSPITPAGVPLAVAAVAGIVATGRR